MSLIISKYENGIDKCWYNSTNVIYSECIDNKDALKDLIVVFHDGRSYKYKSLIVQDVLLFKAGGLDGSNGRALNKFIKKYNYEKLENVDLTLLEEEKHILLEEKKLKEQLKEEDE